MGKHTLRFGVDLRRELYNALMFFAPSDDYGDFAFNGSITNYSFGDFLLGMPNQTFFAHSAHKSTPTPANGACTVKTMAGEQPSHRQFRIAVGIASAVSGNLAI